MVSYEWHRLQTKGFSVGTIILNIKKENSIVVYKKKMTEVVIFKRRFKSSTARLVRDFEWDNVFLPKNKDSVPVNKPFHKHIKRLDFIVEETNNPHSAQKPIDYSKVIRGSFLQETAKVTFTPDSIRLVSSAVETEKIELRTCHWRMTRSVEYGFTAEARQHRIQSLQSIRRIRAGESWLQSQRELPFKFSGPYFSVPRQFIKLPPTWMEVAGRNTGQLAGRYAFGSAATQIVTGAGVAYTYFKSTGTG